MSKTVYGDTPLALAAGEGHGGVVAVLLEHNDIQADSQNSFETSPLVLAAKAGNFGIASMLHQRRDVDSSSRDAGGCTPLARTATMGHERILGRYRDQSAG